MMTLTEFIQIVYNYGDDTVRAYTLNIVDDDPSEPGASPTVTLAGRDLTRGTAPVVFTAKGRMVDDDAILATARFLMNVKDVDRGSELAAWAHSMRGGEVPSALRKQGFLFERITEEVDGEQVETAVITEDGKERARFDADSSLGKYNEVWRQVTAAWEVRRRLAAPDADGTAPLSGTAMSAVSQEPALADEALEALIGELSEPLPTPLVTADIQARGNMRRLEALFDGVVAALAREGVGGGNGSLSRSSLEKLCSDHGFVFSEVANPRGREGEPSLFVIRESGDTADPLVMTGQLHAGEDAERILPPFGVSSLRSGIKKMIGEQAAKLAQRLQDEAPDVDRVVLAVHRAAEQHLAEHPEELREAPRIAGEEPPGSGQGEPG